MTDLPAVFVTHGAPTLVVDDTPARAFLAGLGAEIGTPDAILCLSAHWERSRPGISTANRPQTIHVFYGFPPSLYELAYPAPGAPDVASRAAMLIRDAGLACDEDPGRGLDHGAWTPLMLMYPKADIPVAQISVQSSAGPAHHLALGAALEPLRADNVLILASGSATHDLSKFGRHGLDAPPIPEAAAFDDWLVEIVARGDTETLADYRRRAPHAASSHPTEEHFLPLFAAIGAGGGGPGRVLHRSCTYGIIAMTAFAFGEVPAS